MTPIAGLLKIDGGFTTYTKLQTALNAGCKICSNHGKNSKVKIKGLKYSSFQGHNLTFS